MSLTFATEKELAVDNTPAESSLDSLDGTTFDSDEESKPVEKLQSLSQNLCLL